RIDPALRQFNFSTGGKRQVRYALRMGAGFGSQLSFSLMRAAPAEGRFAHHEAWLRSLGGSRATLFCEGRVLKMRSLAEKAEQAARTQSAEHAEQAQPVPVGRRRPRAGAPAPAELALALASAPRAGPAGYNPWAS